MGAWVELKLEVLQNESFSYPIYYFGPAPDFTPTDLSGCTVSFSARKAQNDTAELIINLAVGTGLTLVSQAYPTSGEADPSYPNGVSIAMTPAQTEPLAVGNNWYWDMVATFPSGVKYYIGRGVFQVTSTAAR